MGCCNDSVGQGRWIFPNKTEIGSRNTNKDIFTTRELSSIILQSAANTFIPTGHYTCELPDSGGRLMQLKIYLYRGSRPSKKQYI